MKQEFIAENISGITFPACRSAAFYCVEDDELLYSYNINEPIVLASITKLLTACTAMEFLSFDSIITVGSEIKLINEHSSIACISPGHRLTFLDLLTGMLISSGCDAAYTIAAAAGRAALPDKEMENAEAVRHFVKLMNAYASSIGMENSHFVNPDGWDNANQYSTVSDLIKLSVHALSVPELREIVGTHEKYVVFNSGESITWINTNRLLDHENEYYCPDTIGIKTGTTNKAGCCICSAFSRSNKTYIDIVLGCKTKKDLYELVLNLLSAFTGNTNS